MIKKVKSIALASLPLGLLVCLLIVAPFDLAQTPQTPRNSKRQPDQDQSDVLRVYTQLVQTDVMVFDKQGRFVNGLKAGDFELRIDGAPKPIDFFEKITAGSSNEETQLAAARGSATSSNSNGPAPLDRGRPIFFYVDDLHLDLAGLQTTQKLIPRFIDQEMGQNDEAAIASASGQIGFLQQLTDNKAVLHAALERLKFRPYSVRDSDRPPISEYQAVLVGNNDYEITDYLVEETMRQTPGLTREMAESMVNARSQAVSQQGSAVTSNTLAGLESLIRSAKKLPGRKLLFFISSGFFIDDRNSNTRSKLQQITSAAARSGVVIYSMDARGLVSSLNDISNPSGFDVSGRLERANSGELRASQDSMFTLAADTGGRAVFNTNSLGPGLSRALKETSTYYLLAWKPERESQQTKFRRIEVKVVGRPDLTVQVRRGFFDREPENAKTVKADKIAKDKNENDAVKSPAAELRKVMLAPYPTRDLPVSLNLSFLDTPAKGLMLSTALEVPNEVLSFVPGDGKQTAVLTVVGNVFDDKGNAGGAFNNRLTVTAPSVEAARRGTDVKYGYPIYVKPGLYQVRVGVRDETSGRAGSAQGWIEIPNLASGQLTLSSLLLGARAPESPTASAAAIASAITEDTVPLSISHNFTANGYLRFLVIVYNAALAPADTKPDLAVQLQIVRDGQPVTTTALRKISVEGLPDLTRIPYAAEISLSGLPAGRYLLQVTVVDRVAKKSASQQNRFAID